MSLQYGQMMLTVELVTPELAENWQKLLNVKNRRFRPGVAASYADDMRRGAWIRKPVPICFDEHGLIGNGQHTLAAIIQSGITQELLIARHVPAEAIAVMDVGLKRSFADVAHFVGNEVGSREAAIARTVAVGPASTEPRSFAFLFAEYLRHQHAIDTLCAIAPKRAGFSASVMATLVRAWHGHDHARILEFVDVMKRGVVRGPEDTAAIRLRDYCRNLKSGGGRGPTIETYKRAQSALYAFLKRKQMAKLYGSDRELFPLPEDNE